MKNAISNVWPVPGLLKTPNTLRLWFNETDYTADVHRTHHLLANVKKKNLNYVSPAKMCALNKIMRLEKSNLYKYHTRFCVCPLKYADFFCTKPVYVRWAQFQTLPSPVRAGRRILILVRQADPRFTPRVWLLPIVHCQGLLMEGQQWIPYPHKWLSDRAPSSITSYNVEVQKMRPLGRLIWCFICSFEILFNFLSSPSLQQL